MTSSTSSENNLPIGPLSVQPEQWSHGARIAVVHPVRGVIAVIEPVNDDDEPDSDTAEREPWDEPYAHLFAAAPELLDALKLARRWQHLMSTEAIGKIDAAITKAERGLQ